MVHDQNCQETRQSLSLSLWQWLPTSGSNTHHQLAGEALLCVAGALSQSGEELGHALVLAEGGVALKGLLDQPTQLLGLMHTHTHCI